MQLCRTYQGNRGPCVWKWEALQPWLHEGLFIWAGVQHFSLGSKALRVSGLGAAACQHPGAFLNQS